MDTKAYVQHVMHILDTFDKATKAFYLNLCRKSWRFTARLVARVTKRHPIILEKRGASNTCSNASVAKELCWSYQSDGGASNSTILTREGEFVGLLESPTGRCKNIDARAAGYVRKSRYDCYLELLCFSTGVKGFQL